MLTLIALIAMSPQPGLMTLEEVVAAHMAYVEALHSWRLQYSVYDSRDGKGGYTAELKLKYTADYRKLGDREHLRLFFPSEHLYVGGPKGDFLEAENGPGGWRVMRGYNPASPEKLSESKNWPINGSVASRKRGRNLLTKEPKVDLHLEFVTMGKERECLNLREFLKRADNVRLRAGPGESRDKCYEIGLAMADFNIVLYVSPAYGYSVQKIVATYRGGRETTSELSNYLLIGGGVWFPRKKSMASLPFRIEYKIENLQFNEPMSDEELEVRFPEWTPVNNENTGEVYVWGNGAPKFTFKNYSAYQAWYDKRRGFDPATTALLSHEGGNDAASYRAAWVWFVGLFVLLAVFAMIWRRRHHVS